MTTPPGSWTVKFLPPGNVITERTEFVFINGVPFVMASKHEEVVRMHCDEKDRLTAWIEENVPGAQVMPGGLVVT